MKQPGAITHDRVIDILIEKGYLAHRYPMTATEFHPALLAALTAAPSAGGNTAGDLQNSEWATDPRTRGRVDPSTLKAPAQDEWTRQRIEAALRAPDPHITVDDGLWLLQQRDEWIARFNQLPEIVARAEERGRCRASAAASDDGAARHPRVQVKAPDGSDAIICTVCNHEISYATKRCQCDDGAARPQPAQHLPRFTFRLIEKYSPEGKLQSVDLKRERHEHGEWVRFEDVADLSSPSVEAPANGVARNPDRPLPLTGERA